MGPADQPGLDQVVDPSGQAARAETDPLGELAHPQPSAESQQHKSPAPSLAVEIHFLAMLDDERGFIVNAIWLADLAKVFILL